MTIKAHSLATKIDTAAGTVTFSMLNRNDIAVVEHAMSIEEWFGIVSFVLTALEDAGMLEELDDLEDETEVAGHC